MIAVDWGTSNFRAFRLNAEGAVVARRSSPQGILRVDDGNFEAALRAEVGAWLAEGENHILLCGMIGSRQGWVEAEYLPCPVGIEELANAVVQVPFAGAEVRLVPGVIGTGRRRCARADARRRDCGHGHAGRLRRRGPGLFSRNPLQVDSTERSQDREFYHLHDRRNLQRFA